MFALMLAVLIGQVDSEPTLHWVRHEGSRIQVQGQVMPNGQVRWDMSTPFNVNAIRNAARPAPVVNYGLGSPEQMHRPIVSQSPAAKRFIAEAKTQASDDASVKIHLTVIGGDQDRDKLMADLKSHPAFATLKDHLLIQGYRPDEWAVNPEHGFVVSGKPSIIAQQGRGPDDPKGGRVVYRALDYSMGPDKLAADLKSAVRKIDPTYDSGRDPGPANTQPSLLDQFSLSPDERIGVLFGAGMLIVIYLMPRKEQS